MKRLTIIILAIFAFVSCGIKGDPVPPTKPFDWGKDTNKKKKSENSEN
jgi:predicted small lipoprotein YifL